MHSPGRGGIIRILKILQHKMNFTFTPHVIWDEIYGKKGLLVCIGCETAHEGIITPKSPAFITIIYRSQQVIMRKPKSSTAVVVCNERNVYTHSLEGISIPLEMLSKQALTGKAGITG
jgi:hypothetical protein